MLKALPFASAALQLCTRAGPVLVGDPAVGDPALAGGLDKMTHRGPFQPLPCCDSVGLVPSIARPKAGVTPALPGLGCSPLATSGGS